ncbi:MAG TPA: EAL domain-containing protein [Rugosimonospora sp.]|nr:EAL domain-containing protein [Rugosimonospora sp.]
MTPRKWFAVYWAWMAVLTVGFYALPGWHIFIWSTIGISSCVAIVMGVLRNRPRRRWPWFLLAGAVLAFAAGDTTYNILVTYLGKDNPFPSAADLFYSGTCAMQIAGMFGLSRSGARERDWAGLIDSLIITSGVALFYWLFLIGPSVHRGDLTTWEKAVTIAYPISDVLVLALLARLAVSVRRSRSVLWLGLGTGGLLIADVAYGVNQLGGNWHVGGPIDLGWIALYTCWGAAALDQSMVTITDPRDLRPSGVSAPRLTLLALCSLVAPATLLIELVRARSEQALLTGVLSVVVFLLVLARLAGTADTNRRGEARERGVRRAGTALVAATGPEQVLETVRVAVGALVPRTAEHRLVLIEDGRVPGALLPGGVPDGAGQPRATRLMYTRSLGRDLAGKLAPFDTCLLGTLGPPEADDDDLPAWHLVVAAPERVLLGMRDAVEVLASQAALALARISLTERLGRRTSEAYFRTLVHNTADVILIVADDNTVRYASPSAEAIFGPRPIEGTVLTDAISANSRPLADQLLQLVRLGRQPTTVRDWELDSPAGTPVQVEVDVRDLRADPTVRGLVLTLRDVTERRRLEHELRHRAFHDALTGLANRVLFHDRVQQAVGRARRAGGIVGVLFIDLDDFKVVNDTLGHPVGDQLLVAVADRLKRVLRPQDSAARLGGDEFAALIQDARDPDEIERVAERIVAAMAEPFRLGPVLAGGGVSVGVATTQDAGDDTDLLRQADLALYVAKGGGKGQWRRYQAALHTAVLERMKLRTELDQAVEHAELELVYQPIVALETGDTVGFEALARWRHPTKGVIMPSQFIEVAEETGLIVPIGDRMLRAALAAASQWRAVLPEVAPYVGVNVSVRQFRAPGFVDSVRRRLDEAGLPASLLLLEITESLLLPDEEQVWEGLRELREMGVRVAIDDFGTGYSSLSYLQKVPLDVVKVDRSFIEPISTSDQQRALVEGIVRLAGTLGLQVIAEGIENPVDRDLLIRMGCPLGQGYLFSRPMNYPDSVDWLRGVRVAA